MAESLIGQRLKILIELLKLDPRTFSQAMDVAETTTRNYLNRGTKPGAEYLEKISNSFSAVNLHWLLTGKGEPFLTQIEGSSTVTKINSGNSIGKNTGMATQHQGATSGNDQAALAALALAQKENEHLREQLRMKDELLAAKEDMLTLLRSSFTKPN